MGTNNIIMNFTVDQWTVGNQYMHAHRISEPTKTGRAISGLFSESDMAAKLSLLLGLACFSTSLMLVLGSLCPKGEIVYTTTNNKRKTFFFEVCAMIVIYHKLLDLNLDRKGFLLHL